MIKSISCSLRIIPKNAITRVTGFSEIPNLTTIREKNWKELRKLAISQV